MWLSAVAFISITTIAAISYMFYTVRASHPLGGRRRPPRSVNADAVSCDARYGTLIESADGSGRHHCQCYWPSLVGDENTDCSLARACNNGLGKLVHRVTRVPLDKLPPDSVVDIHEFECDRCEVAAGGSGCTEPGADPLTGLPSCVPTRLADRSGGLCSYEVLYPPTGEGATVSGKHTSAPVLAIDGEFVDKRFATSFKNANRHNVYVPNPCSFDAFRVGVSIENECRLTLTPSGTGYCEPLTETVATVVFDDDYLANNGGRYSNACFKFTTDKKHIGAYVVEYFVRHAPPAAVMAALTSGNGVTAAAAATEAGRSAVPPRTPPLPVVSLEIDVDKIDPELIEPLGLRSTLGVGGGGNRNKVLISHGEIPGDAESLPTPFDKRSMSRFQYEHNDFVSYLPTRCAAIFKCLAPVQKVKIPYCDSVNEERDISGFSLKTVESDEYDILRQQSVVACREPAYDRRLAVVPNIDVNPLGAAYNANPTSAVLRFDKSDWTVRPYWYRSFFNNKQEVKRYVSNLPSRPAPYRLGGRNTE